MHDIRQFCEEYGFAIEATTYFSTQYQELIANTDAHSIFCAQLQAYRDDLAFDHIPVLEQLRTLAETTNIHKYTVEMLYLLCLMPDLKEHYRREGIPMQYYDGFAGNLKTAATGCKRMYGVWGTNIAWWLMDFFKLKLFSIGRLQFRRRKFRKDIGDYTKGDYYIDVHVPGGAPLTPELCAASYTQAASFFRKHYSMTDIVFGCHSWLISPDLESILPAKSNILAFSCNYTILEIRTDPTSSAVSFIFDIPALPEDIDTLPEDTSLQKAIKKHLKAGNTINTAFGVMAF